MVAVTYEQMKQRQAMPLDAKIRFTEQRIKAWYLHFYGAVYVSYSGGKDSTVLLDITKRLFPDVPAVFCDTGLEYPEVREIALRNADVVLKPEMTFKQVLQQKGYPVVGKKQAKKIRCLQNASETNKASCNFYRTGLKRDGTYSKTGKLADRWLTLVDAPFKVSEQCCDIMKKNPFKRYQKETGRYCMTAMMAEESEIRRLQYLKRGCNAFDSNDPKSTPMAIWTESDVLEYILTRNIEYAGCYGDIVKTPDGYKTTGEHRTGCMFCMFGIQYDGTPNRFQRMERDYPKQYEYCINKLGIGKVLDYVGIPYRYQPTLFDEGV